MSEPVEFEIRADCATYVQKPCAECGKQKGNTVHRKKNVEEGLPFCKFKRQIGCVTCGLPKSHDAHFGSPPSFNAFAGGDPRIYRSLIETWKSIFLDRLRIVMPEGSTFSAIMVESEATFPKPARRDQGNFRAIPEKALGDALVAGGYLADDDWDHYEFGGLSQRVVAGVSATRLILFPRA